MRRLQLAWVCSNIGAWMGGLALAVYAFDRDGAVAVGVLALVRTVFAGFAAPFLGIGGEVELWVSLAAGDFLVKLALAALCLAPYGALRKVFSDRMVAARA